VAVGFQEAIKKYNPHHGSNGRFSSADGATMFSIPKNPHLAAKLKAKEQQRTSAPAGKKKEPAKQEKSTPKTRTKTIDRSNYRQSKGNTEDQTYATEHANKTYGKTATKIEKDAITTYTGIAYAEINSTLRKKESLDKKSAVGKAAKHLENVISKTQIQEDIVVYRGVKTGVFGVANKKEFGKLVGKTVQDHGFMSTTIDKGKGNMFADRKNGAVMEIAVPKGAHGIFANGHSSFQSECELILQKGSKIKIISVENLNSKIKPVKIIAEYVS